MQYFLERREPYFPGKHIYADSDGEAVSEGMYDLEVSNGWSKVVVHCQSERRVVAHLYGKKKGKE